MNLIFLLIFFILYLIIFYKEDFIDMKKLKIKNKDENPIFKSNISLDVNDSIYAPKYCLYHPTDKSQAICFDENDLFNNPNTSIGRSNINNNIKKIKDKLTFYKSKGFHSENDKQHWINTKNNIEKNWRDGEKEPRICIGNTCLTQDDIRPISNKKGGAHFKNFNAYLPKNNQKILKLNVKKLDDSNDYNLQNIRKNIGCVDEFHKCGQNNSNSEWMPPCQYPGLVAYGELDSNTQSKKHDYKISFSKISSNTEDRGGPFIKKNVDINGQNSNLGVKYYKPCTGNIEAKNVSATILKMSTEREKGWAPSNTQVSNTYHLSSESDNYIYGDSRNVAKATKNSIYVDNNANSKMNDMKLMNENYWGHRRYGKANFAFLNDWKTAQSKSNNNQTTITSSHIRMLNGRRKFNMVGRDNLYYGLSRNVFEYHPHTRNALFLKKNNQGHYSGNNNWQHKHGVGEFYMSGWKSKNFPSNQNKF